MFKPSLSLSHLGKVYLPPSTPHTILIILFAPEVLGLEFLGSLKVWVEFRSVAVIQKMAVTRVARLAIELSKIPVESQRKGLLCVHYGLCTRGERE